MHALAPALAAVAALVVFETTGLDRAVTDLAYDRATQSFPWRHHDVFELVTHDLMKWLVIAFGVTMLVGLASSWKRPEFRHWRMTLFYVPLCLALAPAVVAALKASSFKHCPWDVDVYGGYAPYLSLLDAHPAGLKPGKCFPGGHASGGFALTSMYFALRVHAPRAARNWLLAGLAYGGAMGAARIAQGAHFLSHVVASAVVVWFVCLALYALLGVGRSAGPAPSPRE